MTTVIIMMMIIIVLVLLTANTECEPSFLELIGSPSRVQLHSTAQGERARAVHVNDQLRKYTSLIYDYGRGGGGGVGGVGNKSLFGRALA